MMLVSSFVGNSRQCISYLMVDNLWFRNLRIEPIYQFTGRCAWKGKYITIVEKGSLKELCATQTDT